MIYDMSKRLVDAVYDSGLAGGLVTEVRIGLIYTAVKLISGHVGIALTFYSKDAVCGRRSKGKTNYFAGRSAGEIVELVLSRNLHERSVGIAAANAVFLPIAKSFDTVDVDDALTLKNDDRVGMVGYFGPLVDSIEARVRELLIAEAETVRDVGRELLSPERAVDMLASSDVALITGTAFVNGTIDELLEASEGCREVAIAGATTPMNPKIYEDTPVTLICGSTVTNGDNVLRTIGEAGGIRALKGFLSKKCFRRNRTGD